MNAYTKTVKGGGDMNVGTSPKNTRVSGSLTYTKRPIVDWSEETIIVNGSPLTIIFPDEDKPVSREKS